MLPQVNKVQYEVELPVSKEKVKIHPFTVKEQKVLLQALEDGSAKVIASSLFNITQSCSDIDIKFLPGPDVEYLFIQIRMKSVGETSVISYPCDICETPNAVTVNLEEVVMKNAEGNGQTVVQLTDDIGVTMQPPVFGAVESLMEVSPELNTEILFKMVEMCIVNIFDKEEVHTRDDFDIEELGQFMDGLTGEQFEKMSKFFENLPRLGYDIKFVCKDEKCGYENSIEVEGLQNFFG